MIGELARKLYCPSCNATTRPYPAYVEQAAVAIILQQTPAGPRVHTRCKWHAHEIEGEQFTVAQWEERRQALRVLRHLTAPLAKAKQKFR